MKESEKVIKVLKDNEQHLLEIVETQKKKLSELKIKLSNDPALHTLEYVEKEFEKKLDGLKTSILSTIKEECKKSYADVITSDFPARPVTPEKIEIKRAVRDARKEEIAEEMEKSRRSKNIIIHGVKEDTSEKDGEWVK